MKYRPEVDGLRAVAILPVVLYHAGVAGFPGGFIGVDVFFVISGYLITSIILSERRAGHFTLTGFYARRIRRIFPALFVMMAVSYPVAWLLLGPSAMREFAGSIAASTVFLANVYFLDVSGYFATAAELKPLLHNWSLSVEEQFYLFFPMVVLLSWRAGPKVQAGLFFGLALASLGLAQWQISQGDAAPAFFLLQTRLWELLAGALTALWLSGVQGAQIREGGRYRPLALIGLAMILTAVVAYDGETPFPGVAALLPVVGAVLVITFAAPQGLAGRVLAWRPIVFVGLLSYSLYLWHVPLLAFTRIGTGREDTLLMLGVCGVALGMAYLSWRYVERPFRRLHSLPPQPLFGAAALCMVLLGGLGFAGVQTDGFRDHYLKHRLDAVSRANYEIYKPHTIRAEDAHAGSGCQISIKSIDPEFVARFEACSKKHGKAVLLVGDSHAGNIYEALHSANRIPFLVVLWSGGCRPFRPKPQCPYEPALEFLETHGASVSQVILHVSGSHYIADHRGETDSDAAFVAGNRARIATDNIHNTAAYVARLSSVVDAVWLGPFAEARVDLENPENYSPDRLRFNTLSLDLFKRLDAEMKAEVRDWPELRYISLVDTLEFNSETLLQEGCMTFSDADHLSACGAQLFGPAIAEALAQSEATTQLRF